MTALDISVVVPVLDGARWLEDALGSIAAQDLPACEVIVVEDGSTDRSREIALAARYVRVVDGPRRGVVAAYQAGFDAVSGDVVVTIGQDDTFAAGAFSAFAAALAQRPDAGYACGQVQLFTDELEHFSGLRSDRIGRPYRARAPEAVAFRAGVLQRFPLREQASVAWDVDLFLRMEDAGVRMAEVDQLVAYKRLRPDSAIHRRGESQRAILEAVRGSVARKRGART